MGMHLRSSLRAPLNREVLYIDDNHVLKCLGANISEGGILLSLLPHVPDINLIPLLIEIPNLPYFNKMDREAIKAFDQTSINSEIVRVRAKIVRTFEGKSEVDKIFIQNIGCQFIDTEVIKKRIPKYIEVISSNIIFLLGLFESSHRHDEQVIVIRKIAEILGHEKDLPLPFLRQKILHDYQSLEKQT